MAGIVAGNGAASTGPNFTHTLKGVAPNANIINLPVLDAKGNGREWEVIAAIDEAIALKNSYNIRVINLSTGHPVYESFRLDPLRQAVEAAWRAGITVVVAGNIGRDNSLGMDRCATITSPGNDPYMIMVGATNANYTPWRGDDKIASYSSTVYNSQEDIFAAGAGYLDIEAAMWNTDLAEFPALSPVAAYHPDTKTFPWHRLDR